MKSGTLLSALCRKCLALVLALAMLASAGLAEEAELLKNGDFSHPLNWQLYTESGGAAQLGGLCEAVFN